jgi:hypothetical protein
MNSVGGQNFKGFSAEMHPAKELDPLVPEILRLARYPIDDLYPKSWPLPQTDVFERTERKRNKGPELALKPRRHRTELFAPLPVLAFQFLRIGITPIGGDASVEANRGASRVSLQRRA